MAQFCKTHQSLFWRTSASKTNRFFLPSKYNGYFGQTILKLLLQSVRWSPLHSVRNSLTFGRRVRKSPSSATFEVMMRQESFDCGHTVNASISSSIYTWWFALGLIFSPHVDVLLPPGPRKCLSSVLMDVTALVLLSVVSPAIWTFLSTINLTSWGSHFHSDSWFLLVF